MNSIVQDLQILFHRELNSLIRELELFEDETLIWATPKGISNSCGVLAQHIAGNLQHYIGAVLGNSSYKRHRDKEFTHTQVDREVLIAELRKVASVVSDILPGLNQATLDSTYPEHIRGMEFTTQRFLLHLSAHLAFHVGQVGYLRRILSRENESSGALSLSELAGE